MKRKDNVELICSVSEISSMFKKAGDIPHFLDQTVRILSRHMLAEVCSIYLYNDEDHYLTLSATAGLSPESVGKVRLYLGEGLTGKALKEYRIIREAHGSKNPFFKPVPGTNEEKYEAFLVVPIHIGLQRIGAIVLQHSRPGYFSEHDARAIKAIASQLASLMENARLLMLINEESGKEKNRAGEILSLVKGQKAREGIAIGLSIIINQESWITDPEENCITDQIPGDFTLALNQTILEIEELQESLSLHYADVASLIFSSHLLMLQDSGFSGKMSEKIEQGETARNAVIATVQEYIDIFSGSENARIREKIMDIKDLGHRILRNLEGNCAPAAEYSGKIIIADEVLPSELIKISAQGALGMILLSTGVTAHLSILAKSLNIPVIFCENEQISKVKNDSVVIIDAYQGNIIINPDRKVIASYEATKEKLENAFREKALEQTHTSCGVKIRMLANINILSDLETAVENNAEGIGLYRSEFPFLIRNEFPSEEEQVRVYRQLFSKMEGKEVTLRTLDIGGDKILSYIPDRGESNPFLGLRAIRFSLKNKDIFKTQLRAMLRAGVEGRTGIMFPLVSSIDDFLEAKKVLTDCIYELEKEDTECIKDPKIGAMVELPSLIEVIDEISMEADFLCIGTNDLIQYLLGVDRTNKEISNLYIAHHPSVFRAINRIITSAVKNGCDISICGEIASDPHFLPFLIGTGIRKISLDPHSIPTAQKRIAANSLQDMEKFAADLLQLGSMKQINEYLQKV